MKKRRKDDEGSISATAKHFKVSLSYGEAVPTTRIADRTKFRGRERKITSFRKPDALSLFRR